MTDQNHDLSTSKSKGDILEQHVEHLFKTAGFKTTRNIRIASYEVDVLAEFGDRRVVIECKNYQNSSLTVRNIVHQWSSKNRLINAHKVIIVIAGKQLNESDRNLAAELDITLWDEDDFAKLFSESLKPDSFKEILLKNISLKPITISERWAREIMFELCLPAFSRFYKSNNEKKYLRLERWLNRFILTELSLQKSDRDTRTKHIRLFVNLKVREAKFVGIRNLSYEDYWSKLKATLANEDPSVNPLDKDTSGRYIAYMYELEREWENQTIAFLNPESSESLNLKLTARVMLMIRNEESFQICIGSNKNNEIRVKPIEMGYSLEVLRINQQQADTLDWIITSNHLIAKDAQVGGVKQYFWFILSPEDLLEKLTRVIIEYFRFETNDELYDAQIENQVILAREV